MTDTKIKLKQLILIWILSDIMAINDMPII